VPAAGVTIIGRARAESGAPAQALGVVGGEVVGRQQSWLGERTAGFRVRCASAP
jgi:hypothetical protein